MMRLAISILLACTFLLALSPALRAGRPSVILIMTDDQGYGDLGVTGNPIIRTPNIDRMARRSASVRHFYVSPVCAPTRACLMTGRYNYRTRAIDTYIGRAMMEPAEVTVAEVLRAAGYATGIFGKWHLGDNYPMRPMDQGFEMSLVHRGGGIGQPSDPPGGEGRYTDPVLFENGKRVQARGYCTDVYFDAGMRWMEKVHGEGRGFFLYLPTNAPHGPFDDVPRDLYDMYKKMDLGNDRFPQDKGHKLPAKANVDRRARIFAMITNIDQNVGRLFEKLGALGLTRNTLVIFMVDNGPNGRRYVAGMRGMKSQVHEGGIRSPFFAHWPARLPAGHVCEKVAAHIDVLPTILDACGVDRPRGLELDGVSILPLLKGERVEWPERTIYIQAHRGDVPVAYHNFAARGPRWKLLHPSGFGRESFSGQPAFELYDMQEDPLEERNVATEHPAVVAKMRKGYDAWFADVSSTRPGNYDPPRIYVGTPHESPTVLTRQDWRRTSKDSGWAGSSTGYWLIHIARGGAYDILLRFSRSGGGEKVELRVAGKALASPDPLEKGSGEYTFEGVSLEAGEARLEARLTRGEKARGVHQVEVTRRAGE
jgi:arylsulfatase/arylsulfatase A